MNGFQDRCDEGEEGDACLERDADNQIRMFGSDVGLIRFVLFGFCSGFDFVSDDGPTAPALQTSTSQSPAASASTRPISASDSPKRRH